MLILLSTLSLLAGFAFVVPSQSLAEVSGSTAVEVAATVPNWHNPLVETETRKASEVDALLARIPTINPELRTALEAQRELLKRQSPTRTYKVGDAAYNKYDFIRVIDDLLSGRYHLDQPYQVEVASDAAVRFTGYYSPEVRVSSRRTSVYRYPIMRAPKHWKGTWPTRRQIEREDALGADTLAIAWARHPLDVYDLQLQGSGFVRFEDGRRAYLAYGGTNRYGYRSIELALAARDKSVKDLSMRGLRAWVSEDLRGRDSVTCANPNYGFFRLSEGEPRGAAGMALTAMVSVAADPAAYPLGAVLIAEVPVGDQPGSFETKLLLVQDTGGAINGDAHLDLYTGIGSKALDIAEKLHTEGRVYMLSPRPQA